MRSLTSYLVLLGLAFALGACQQSTTNTPPNNTNNTNNPPPVVPTEPQKSEQKPIDPKQVAGQTPPHFQDHWSNSTAKDHGGGELKPYYGRQARRLTVDQIKKSIPALFGGITWTNSQNQNMFDVYATTLGKADYIEMTEIDREPSSLFMKFMDDMAASVCTKAVREDLKKTDPQERQVVRYNDDVDKTLRFLRLKFHALYVPPSSTQSIAKLRALYDNILAKTADSQEKAWIGVCIAVVASPDFFAY